MSQLIHPQEVEVLYILPAIRKELALAMKVRKMSQKDIAKLLHVRESTISQYMTQKRATNFNLDKNIKAEIKKSAEKIHNKFDAITETQRILELVRSRQVICSVHKGVADLPEKCKLCSFGQCSVDRDIYLDHSSTTYVDPQVKAEMDKYFIEEYGNPGSFNTVGLKAKKAVDSARENVANILGASSREIIFCGSGTESDNLAIKGVARALKDKGKHIITQKTEHHAVLDTCEYLEKEEGFNVTYLKVDKDGLVDPEDVERAIRNDTILITVMYANNETGVIQPISKIGKIAKKRGVLFHTDACQAGSYLDLNVNKLGVDLMTLNGSKIYGPKGIGVLYIRRGVRIKPIIHGGGQEFGLRSGTENVANIVGFAKALELAQEDRVKESKRLTELRDYTIKNLLKIPKTKLNGHPKKRLPNNVNISFLDVEGEAILLHLDKHGIYASSGSACTSKTLDPSHVILAMGVPYEFAHGSLRITMGKRTTKQDLDKMIKVLPGIVKELRKISPFNVKMKRSKK